MQTRRTLALGQKGVKKFLECYGEQLVCARYMTSSGANAASLSKSSSKNPVGLRLRGRPSLDYKLISRKLNYSAAPNRPAANGIPFEGGIRYW